MTATEKTQIYIVIKDGIHRYYLLKVVKRGLDVYCFPPRLGLHYSLHESGESHFRPDGQGTDGPPVVLMSGEAGNPIKDGIARSSLGDLGRASGIFTALVQIESLSTDFRKFEGNPSECFVIDNNLIPEGTNWVEVGVWAVPERNSVSFESNNPGIHKDLLHKVKSCAPQIWIYARPKD